VEPLVRNLLACALMSAGGLVLIGYTVALLAGWQPPLWLLITGTAIAGIGLVFLLPSMKRPRSAGV